MIAMRRVRLSLVLAALTTVPLVSRADGRPYPWLTGKPQATIGSRFTAPDGYRRSRLAPGCFGQWLRGLPLRPAGTPVHLHDGRKKVNQGVHAAVVDIDVGHRDLQQCADAAMRLRAEFLFFGGRFQDIHFNFTSGDEAAYMQWRNGYRPSVRGNSVSWLRRAGVETSYGSFRKYLDTVFTYAGTLSLSRELTTRSTATLRIGDLFIRGGSPGHAVIVVDMAQNAAGNRLFLLAQSYMPAQDIHILKNPDDPHLSPWYSVPVGSTLRTPEWTFTTSDLKGFGTDRPANARAAGQE
jgi:hypothetical protein